MKEHAIPKVSVIIPVYNVESYIGRCIESLQRQTLKNWELILVDDCSQDQSLKVMKEYASKDSRIRVIHLDENHGPMVARRRGDEAAEGDYISYCDSDDWISDNALEILYSAAMSENADIVIGQFIAVTEDGKEMPFKIHNRLKYGNDKEALFKSILRREVHQGVAGKMFKREIVKHKDIIVYEHCTMSEDAAVLFQYVDKSNRAYVTNDYVYYYYMRVESTTHKKRSILQTEDICKTSLLRKNVIGSYPGLYGEINRYLIQNLVGLSYYNKDLLQKYGLDTILSIKNILIHFSMKDTLKLWLRRDIFPFLFR